MNGQNMTRLITVLTALALATGLGGQAQAQTKDKTPPQLITPDTVKSRVGKLSFKDVYPTLGTAKKIRDELDYLHGVETFMNSVQGVSLYALRKGLAEAGIKDGEFIYTSEMLDSRSLFLTANADTVYFWGNVDVSKGPIVVEVPTRVLGIFDDFWFNWVGDFGLAGADKGQGGKYLLVGPGYKGPLPEGGYFVRKSKTNLITVLFRAFLDENSPAPAIARVKSELKVYPYKAGGFGHSVGTYLAGEAPLGQPAEPISPRFVDGSGMVINTIPPSDFGHFEMLNEIVQREPAEALDPELAGQFAAIGIVKGKEFAPDARMRKILEQAAAFGNAASRTLAMGAHPDDHFRYYGKSSAWFNMLFTGGYDFMNPPPQILKSGMVEPSVNRGARQIHSRTSFFYVATGATPAMVMRLTNVGSQYLIANVDKAGEQFDGAKTYKVVLPKDIPAARFWSFTVYDNQHRSMLATPQRWPRAGSQSYPTPAAKPNADGSTTVYFGPKLPEGVHTGNWIQTDPAKSWFVMLRLYSPLESFFDKTWRVSEVELVN
jgi:hypothetical protein